MKKILFFFSILVVSAMIYGYSESGKPEVAVNHDKQETAQVSRPDILKILTADTSMPGWSSSFLRNYIYGNTNKDGC